ncbi:MAG: hypothetical protein KAW91_07370, partial [candidate division Zixibacteria bacterium]|nr:hypothetical protein [candidate division Zixibacteria bacterium]
LLALFYARSILNRFVNDQRTQVSNINKQISGINKQVSNINKQVSNINKQVSGLKKDISLIKDDVFIIGYDILKEQNKLAERVSRLEDEATNEEGADRPSNDSIE